MKNEIQLTALQIEEVRREANDARKAIGIYGDVPIANDLFRLLENNEIIICEYPFESSADSHTDATLTRFEFPDDTITFIGLNTSLPYDEQIFALAHELYHFRTKTGKSYCDDDTEDPVLEKKADRFAAELLLPGDTLRSRVISEFGDTLIDCNLYLRTLRFVVRLQCEWWLPYRSIVRRLFEEGYIRKAFYEMLYEIDDRDESSIYCSIFKSIDSEKYEFLNCRTRRSGVSAFALEKILLNYEDGDISDDEFVDILAILGKTPKDLGYSIGVSDADLSELDMLFEDGERG